MWWGDGKGGEDSANRVVPVSSAFFVRGLILWKNLQMAVRSDDGSGIRWIFCSEW